MNEQNPKESTNPVPVGQTCGPNAERRVPGRYSMVLGILKVSIVLALLALSFATLPPSPSEASVVLLVGPTVFVTLAFWPPYHQPFEAWMCLLVILACGAFGLVHFVNDLAGIHPWDQEELVRLYVGWGLIAGMAAVTPYALLRLAVLGRDR